jgi:hypothetical protein
MAADFGDGRPTLSIQYRGRLNTVRVEFGCPSSTLNRHCRRPAFERFKLPSRLATSKYFTARQTPNAVKAKAMYAAIITNPTATPSSSKDPRWPRTTRTPAAARTAHNSTAPRRKRERSNNEANIPIKDKTVSQNTEAQGLSGRKHVQPGPCPTPQAFMESKTRRGSPSQSRCASVRDQSG